LWKPNPTEKEDVVRMLRKLVPDHSFFDATGADS